MTIQSSDVTPTTPTPDAPQGDGPSPSERFAAFFQEKPPEQPAPATGDPAKPEGEKPPAEAKDPAAPAVAAKPEGEPKPEPIKPKGEAIQLARAQEQISRLTTSERSQRERADAAEAKLTEWEKKAKGDGFKFLEEVRGETIQEIFARASKGEWDKKNPLDELPEDVKADLEFARKAREREAKAEADAAAAKERADDMEYCGGLLKELAAELPNLDASSTDWLVNEVYKWQDRHGGIAVPRDEIVKLAKQMDAHAGKNYETWFSDKALLKRMAAIPSVKAALLEALGPDQQKPAADPKDPRGTPDKTTNLPLRPEVLERTERSRDDATEREEHIRGLRAMQERAAAVP